jgi:putative ABC transport system substrate-binding protein
MKASSGWRSRPLFATLIQLQAAALVSVDSFFTSQREQLVALAACYAVPSIYSGRDVATLGGLITYGARNTAAFRELAAYAGKVLSGAKPADV